MALALLITVGLAAGSILLALVSDAFTHEMSRLIETAFDWIEYRLALRERERASGRPRVASVRAEMHVVRSGVRLVAPLSRRAA